MSYVQHQSKLINNDIIIIIINATKILLTQLPFIEARAVVKSSKIDLIDNMKRELYVYMHLISMADSCTTAN